MTMDEEIIQCVKSCAVSEASVKELQKLVLSHTDEAILNFVDKRCSAQDPCQAIADYARAMFQTLAKSLPEENTSRSSNLLVKIVMKCVSIFQSRTIPVDKKCIDCVDFFVQKLDVLPRHMLPSIAELILSNIDHITDAEDGIELQLLPPILKFLNSTDEVTVDDRVSSGSEYAAFVFKRFLDSKWSTVVLEKIVSIAKEIHLGKAESEELLDRIFECAKFADPQDLPGIVYQMLVYASKTCNRKGVVAGILRLFEELDVAVRVLSQGKGSSVETLRQVEGTVLLHTNFAIKHDPCLGQELLRSVRGRHTPPGSFTVALLLSLARIPRFEQASLAFLRTAVIKSYQDFHQARGCRWLPDSLRKQCLHFAKSVEHALLQSVEHSNFGRDHIVPTIVKIGFALIESSESFKVSLMEPHYQSNGFTECKDLGIQILRTAFEVHEMARNEIIEQSNLRIISLKPQHSLHVIRLIDQLVLYYPHLVLEHSGRLKECLDYFTFLNPLTASSLVRTICPLFQMSRDLQNYTILVLRKSMFGREEASRVAGTRAIIDLIALEKKAKTSNSDFFPSSSQASCSQHTNLTCEVELNLFQELKGLLRKCLSQQAHVKAVVYKGLVNLVLVDPASAGAVFELLWSHFLRYCVYKEDGGIHLKLSDCVKLQNGGVSLEEPLDLLFSCIRQLLILQPQNKSFNTEFSWMCLGFSLSQENEVGAQAGESFASAFLNLRKSLIKSSSLEDYNFGREQDLSVETLEDEKILEQAHMFCGVLEVLLDAVVSDMRNCTDDTYTEIKKEFEALLAIYDSLDQSFGKKQGSLRRKSGLKSSFDSKAKTKEFSYYSSHNLGNLSNPVTRLFSDVRIPFLTTSNIAHLLEASLELINDGRPSSEPLSQHRTQGTVQQQSCHQFRLAFFALRTCVRHLKAFSTDLLLQERSQNFVEFFVQGDIRLLGCPLLKLLGRLLSVSNLLSAKEQERRKEVKGKKLSDESPDGLLYMVVICVDLLFKHSASQDCLTAFLEELLSVSDSEEDAIQAMDSEMDAVNVSDSLEAKLIHVFLSKKIQPFMQKFLTLKHFREFEVLSGIVIFLGSRLPPLLRKVHGAWIDSTFRRTRLKQSGAARCLVTMLLQLSLPPTDLTLGQEIASELLKVTGSDEHDPVDGSDVLYFINTSTKNCIANVLLQYVEATLADVDWLISKLKAYPLDETSIALHGGANNDERVGRFTRSKLEHALHCPLDSLVRMFSYFANMTLEPSVAEHFLRVATRLYKSLALMTKCLIAPKGYTQSLPSSTFQSLAEYTCKKLTASLYNFVAVMQRDQQEQSQAKGAVNQIKRECKTIPNLIFHVEDYEKYLIQLSKVSKVNLMKHAKRSTARDFKILNLDKIAKQDNENNSHPHRDAETASLDKETGDDEGEERENEESSESSEERMEGTAVATQQETGKESSPAAAATTAQLTITDSDSDNNGNDGAQYTVKMSSRKRRRPGIIDGSDDEAESGRNVCLKNL